jgi:hypothetical protein
MVALKGDKPFPNFNRASEFSFGGTGAKALKILGKLPSSNPEWRRHGLGLYGGPQDDPSLPYRPLVHQTGKLLGTTMSILQGAIAQGTYTPANGAVYNNDGIGRKLMEAAMLFKRTPVKIVGHDPRRLGYPHRPGPAHRRLSPTCSASSPAASRPSIAISRISGTKSSSSP